ncbi:hypothetical protein ACIQ9P_00550 [Kitasatospora sp. NPDC094019]|uniref:hypothetical protein n=1 Tax=Kitasatospora sp. NPDC094019 TaxID=3364091 RepID=UPI0037F60C3A
MNEQRLRRRRRDLEKEIDRLWRLLGLPGNRKPPFDWASGSSVGIRPDGTLGYFWFERGELVSEQRTDDVSELLYWIVGGALYGPEWSLERKSAALYALDPAWGARWCAELAERVGPERRHEVPALPPERPFVLRKSESRRPKQRWGSRAPLASGHGHDVAQCEWCRPLRSEELPAFPRIRLLDR